METIEYSVCVDCYMELAQGEGEDISHHIQVAVKVTSPLGMMVKKSSAGTPANSAVHVLAALVTALLCLLKRIQTNEKATTRNRPNPIRYNLPS